MIVTNQLRYLSTGMNLASRLACLFLTALREIFYLSNSIRRVNGVRRMIPGFAFVVAYGPLAPVIGLNHETAGKR